MVDLLRKLLCKVACKFCIAALLSSTALQAEAIGPLPNLEEGELAGHLNPKSEWGVIDRTGKTILPLQYSRVFVLKQPQNTMLVGTSISNGQQNQRGAAESIPVDYLTVDESRNAISAIKQTKMNRIQYEVMKHGAVCKQLFTELPLRADLKIFSVHSYDTDGFAILRNSRSGESGVIDDSLAWLIKPSRMELVYSKNAVFSFRKPGSALWGLISKNGKVLVQPAFEERAVFNNHNAVVMRKQHEDCQVVIIDDTGCIQRELPEFRHVAQRTSDYCVVRSVKGDRVGVMDLRGNLVIPCVYSDISTTGNGLFAVSDSGTSFIVDKTGKRRSPEFKRIWPSSDEIVPVSDGEPWDINFFDLKSNRLLATKIKFLDFWSHQEEMTIVASNFVFGKLWKLIDKSGKVVFQSPWIDSLEFADDGMVLLNENGRNGYKQCDSSASDRWGYIDFSGRVLIKPSYTDARKFVGGFAAASLGSK